MNDCNTYLRWWYTSLLRVIHITEVPPPLLRPRQGLWTRNMLWKDTRQECHYIQLWSLFKKRFDWSYCYGWSWRGLLGFVLLLLLWWNPISGFRKRCHFWDPLIRSCSVLDPLWHLRTKRNVIQHNNNTIFGPDFQIWNCLLVALLAVQQIYGSHSLEGDGW